MYTIHHHTYALGRNVFCFSGSSDHRDLHSFPTRRSSDLTQKPERVPWHAWFEGTPTDDGELLESTHEVPSLDQVLSLLDRKSTRLNSSHGYISYAVFCLKKKTKTTSRRRSPAPSERCGAS